MPRLGAALRRLDTLALRLFALMWVALVVSHVLAFSVFLAMRGPGRDGPPPRGPEAAPFQGAPGERHGPGGPPRGERPPMPTFPSLPPAPSFSAETPRGPGGMVDPSLPGTPRMPWTAWLLDYGVRVAFIALTAWWGSRWLARPVRRLVAASQALGPALARGQRAAPLDMRDGTQETRAAAQVFNQMATQIQHQFEARGLMIAAISHDLRTPLTRLRMRLETAPVPPELLERCVGDLREMNTLIDGVLEVFRPQQAAELQRTDVAALLQALVDDATEQGAAVTLSAEPVVLDTDAGALKRAVGNLVENALRYAGAAWVTLRQQPDGLHITVDDDGPGIPPERLEEVLQPFVRLESSRNKATGGVGLGLFIARERAERLGGTLTLANRPTGGLRAEIVLAGAAVPRA